MYREVVVVLTADGDVKTRCVGGKCARVREEQEEWRMVWCARLDGLGWVRRGAVRCVRTGEDGRLACLVQGAWGKEATARICGCGCYWAAGCVRESGRFWDWTETRTGTWVPARGRYAVDDRLEQVDLPGPLEA